MYRQRAARSRPLPKREPVVVPKIKTAPAPKRITTSSAPSSPVAGLRYHQERNRRIDRAQARYEWQLAQYEADRKAIAEWNRRYIADAPARAEYYRSLQSAYQRDAAFALERAADDLEDAAMWRATDPDSLYDPWYWGW